MRQNSEPYIVPEGYPFIAITAWITVLLAVLGCTVGAACFWVLTVGVAAFFRNPERRIPEHDKAILSPADGKVIAVEKISDNQFIAGTASKISIFMSVFNVHVNRIPVSGTIAWKRHHAGRFLIASRRDASSLNARVELCIRTDSGETIGVVQVAGWVARRIVCYPQQGDRVVRGARFGMIRFGSRLELYLPDACRIIVKPGDTTKAGEAIVGYLP